MTQRKSHSSRQSSSLKVCFASRRAACRRLASSICVAAGSWSVSWTTAFRFNITGKGSSASVGSEKSSVLI